MGQTFSCHRPAPETGKKTIKDKKHHLSAACNFSDVFISDNRMDINLASEEDLMTLPGIDRSLAHNIVVYRDKIGRFRKIEDVALVTGLGAAKLQQIKSEICVPSRGSSQTIPHLSTLDLLSSTKLNINAASQSELLGIVGVSEDIAYNILQHRTLHGHFKLLDDLLKVKGMDSKLLSEIKPHVTISLPRPVSAYANLSFSGWGNPNPSFSLHSLQNVDLGIPPERSTQPLSMRPLAEPFTGSYDGRKVLRVGSWNLHRLTLDKANNPGVREVVCMTLLENGIKLLAVQEVLQEGALEKICQELEMPTLSAVGDWKGNRGSWKYVILDNPVGQENKEIERVAFLWDSSAGLELVSAIALETQEEGKQQQECSQPLLGRFKIGKVELNVINLHLKPPEGSVTANGQSDPFQSVTLRPVLEADKQVMVMGHFGLEPDAAEFNLLKFCGFRACIPGTICTDISSKNEGGETSHQNIWYSQQTQSLYTGRQDVIRKGLSSPWIPDGWSWGGIVSNHCPIWLELFTE
ncbi:endonuclease/exonuclease/phosphatase family domain-containing protein 1 isoform X2 [Latimeria chalumnae]|uniref:Endonuclease/exonuclease/phosphatase family domain-containing protein 1 n=2 Tax=Latimeria chalumnae TaxID=7897 RepID=H3BHH1_LATCH|nr:PREDICTED: endonuclease/exonuclease/phosphatase family domain-containing protein 1-like isoform X2 [Latimeria chalumnae]|eukprot:XP_005988009.1 PREDICTED: endonuclease/exonuclease/phosphatase family domain-containing protein 1-like isoform X2 [Latimeria chalumnae]